MHTLNWSHLVRNLLIGSLRPYLSYELSRSSFIIYLARLQNGGKQLVIV